MVDFTGEIESENEDEQREPGPSSSSSSSSSVLSSSPQDEIRKLEEEKLCKICKKENVQVVFLPCGHRVSCNQCSSTATQCPLCKISITEKLRTYAS